MVGTQISHIIYALIKTCDFITDNTVPFYCVSCCRFSGLIVNLSGWRDVSFFAAPVTWSGSLFKKMKEKESFCELRSAQWTVSVWLVFQSMYHKWQDVWGAISVPGCFWRTCFMKSTWFLQTVRGQVAPNDCASKCSGRLRTSLQLWLMGVLKAISFSCL